MPIFIVKDSAGNIVNVTREIRVAAEAGGDKIMEINESDLIRFFPNGYRIVALLNQQEKLKILNQKGSKMVEMKKSD